MSACQVQARAARHRPSRREEGGTLRSITTVLRDRTAPVHGRVELAVDLLAPGLTAVRLAAVLCRLHAFFAATEPALDAWSRTDPQTAAALDWPRRRRSALMATDLDLLGVAPLTAPAVFDRIDTARAFGWLYVAEGSTLGGAIIARRIAPLTESIGPAGPLTLRTFSPYPEGPGPMWRSFGSVLDAWVGTDAGRSGAVADAAAEVFEALERWVTPLADEVAA